MPITAIITQPGSSSQPKVLPAYSPIVFRVSAARTDGNPMPPVVFCDVYFGDVFYKSLSATQYAKLNATNTEWAFDISDTCQEFLRRDLPQNGGSVLVRGDKQVAIVYCKFRSSGLDSGGFISTEGVDPVQGTGSTAPKAGSGTQSENFLVINSAIQREDNPDFLQHLVYARRSPHFNANAYPLSHRPARYHVSKNASDYYPFLFLGNSPLAKICVRYKLRGSSSFIETCYNNPLTCDSIVSGVTASVGANGDAAIGFASSGGASQWEYRVDGLSYKPVPSNPFTLTFTNLLIYLITEITGEPVVTDDTGQILAPESMAIYDTDHVVDIRPRCSNGAYGTSGSVTINISSAPACNPPELFELNTVDYTAREVLLNITLPAGKTDFQLEWRFDYGAGVLTPAVVQDYTLSASPFHWPVPVGYNNGTFHLRTRTKCSADSLSAWSEDLPVDYTVPLQQVAAAIGYITQTTNGNYEIHLTIGSAVADDLTIRGYFLANGPNSQMQTFGFTVVIPHGSVEAWGTISANAPQGGTAPLSTARIESVTPNPTSDNKQITY